MPHKKLSMIKLIAILFSLASLFMTTLPKSNDLNISLDLPNDNSVISLDSTNKFKTDEEIKYYQDFYDNQDIIARVSIENTSLNSIVAKTSNNYFYLDHNLKKEKDNHGTTFMDYRNKITDQKLLIYGHNSKNIDTEFHVLENFLNQTFYNNHNIITLKTKEITYRYQIFSVMIVTTNYDHMKLEFTKDSWQKHLNYLKENSLYNTKVEISNKDSILVLQTCYYYPENSYIVISAKKI